MENIDEARFFSIFQAVLTGIITAKGSAITAENVDEVSKTIMLIVKKLTLDAISTYCNIKLPENVIEGKTPENIRDWLNEGVESEKWKQDE